MTSPNDPFPAGTGPVPGSAHARYVADRLAETGRWGTATIADTVAAHAVARPGADAFVEGDRRMSWADYDRSSTALAGGLVAAGLAPGDRLAVLLPDGPEVHRAYVAAEKAGVTVMGIGPRAGLHEVRHLVVRSGATALLSEATHRDHDVASLVAELRRDGAPVRHHLMAGTDGSLVVDGEAVTPPGDAAARLEERRLGLDDIFLLNSTSGTTGMPKCVVHHQNRWLYYHQLAVDAGALAPDDVFLGLVPAPFGFGIWTAHTTPTLLGAPTVVMSRFTPEGALALIERERATVMACVSTQFVMMLNSPAVEHHDLSSLRVMFTGGEAVSARRAAEFEERIGGLVLQFYGSNETGALSYTSVRDRRDQRLETGGHIIDGQIGGEGMDVRLLDDDGGDVTASGGPGQAACRGPATCLGYYDDPAANEQLVGEDGLMRTGDVTTIDDEGFLRVVGRKSDFIIRGGKNISAVVVEEQVCGHPDVAMAAAVAMPDEVFGERVCAYVVLRPGTTLTLDALNEHLASRELSKETFPERLEVVDELPRASGGKVAKGELRADVRRRLSLPAR